MSVDRPVERGVLEEALERGLLTQEQANLALSHWASEQAGNAPCDLDASLAHAGVAPEQVAEVTALWRERLAERPSASRSAHRSGWLWCRSSNDRTSGRSTRTR